MRIDLKEELKIAVSAIATIGLIFGVNLARGFRPIEDLGRSKESLLEIREKSALEDTLYLNSDGEANRILENFPSQISGAENVRKYVTPGAKYCLVHIRQKHLRDENDKNESVRRCQDGIYNILTFLIDSLKIKSVYSEGVTSKGLEMLEELAIVETEARSLGIQHEALMYDAELRLATEGKIEVLPADREDLLNKASILKQRYRENPSSINPFEYLKAAEDDRELFVLETIAKKSNPLGIVVFGGLHIFGGKNSFPTYDYKGRVPYPLRGKDDIYQWNLQYPDKRFSLIEITPRGYN